MKARSEQAIILTAPEAAFVRQALVAASGIFAQAKAAGGPGLRALQDAALDVPAGQPGRLVILRPSAQADQRRRPVILRPPGRPGTDVSGPSIGDWIGGFFGSFVAALLSIPVAGALQVIIREIWQATAWPGPPDSEPPDSKPTAKQRSGTGIAIRYSADQ